MKPAKPAPIVLLSLCLCLLAPASSPADPCIYVADSVNDRVSRWEPQGSAAGWVGGGSSGWKTADGASEGQDYQSLEGPHSLAVDAAGNIYVADYENCRISRWGPNGRALGWIGGGSDGWKTLDGSVMGADYQSFSYPRGVFVDAGGNIYVTEEENHRVSKWDSDGNAIGWIGGGSDGWKTTDGAKSGNDYRSFLCPAGVHVDASGNIYVADEYLSRVSLWDADGNAVGWIGGGSDGWKTTDGAADGDDYQSFDFPIGVFVDGDKNIYVAEYVNERISRWDADGNAVGWIGGGSNGWKVANGAVGGSGAKSFHSPFDVYVDGDGNILVADAGNDRVSKWDRDGNAVGWIGGGSDGWKTADGAVGGNDFRSFHFPKAVVLAGTCEDPFPWALFLPGFTAGR